MKPIITLQKINFTNHAQLNIISFDGIKTGHHLVFEMLGGDCRAENWRFNYIYKLLSHLEGILCLVFHSTYVVFVLKYEQTIRYSGFQKVKRVQIFWYHNIQAQKVSFNYTHTHQQKNILFQKLLQKAINHDMMDEFSTFPFRIPSLQLLYHYSTISPLLSAIDEHALQKKLAQLPAVDMWHAPAKLSSKLHLFACVDVLEQSLRVGVTTEASWVFLHFNCRKLSNFFVAVMISNALTIKNSTTVLNPIQLSLYDHSSSSGGACYPYHLLLFYINTSLVGESPKDDDIFPFLEATLKEHPAYPIQSNKEYLKMCQKITGLEIKILSLPEFEKKFQAPPKTWNECAMCVKLPCYTTRNHLQDCIEKATKDCLTSTVEKIWKVSLEHRKGKKNLNTEFANNPCEVILTAIRALVLRNLHHIFHLGIKHWRREIEFIMVVHLKHSHPIYEKKSTTIILQPRTSMIILFSASLSKLIFNPFLSQIFMSHFYIFFILEGGLLWEALFAPGASLTYAAPGPINKHLMTGDIRLLN
ncbi:hypothetical protein VP01_2028g1 [Puccinia sorghi]|uniref:Uncharacterized protein n=1 Tax=Puccinia sorghi TaxID=27349 RepID=A0A0L6VB81_9BASI|nr:hypothetical protein VP01_2028g1 [Puccinia sorghi]